MKTKHYLVSWSGGVDSTALIYDLLNKGHRVSAVYTEILNNTEQTIREQKAIEAMKEFFLTFKNFKYLGKNSVEINLMSKITLQQVPVWIFSLLNAAPDDVDVVVIGYVMNDDAISSIQQIKKLWKSYRFLKTKLPKIKFPLIHMKKLVVYRSLHVDLEKHITWCESSMPEDRCGQCPSCMRMKHEIGDHLFESLNINEDAHEVDHEMSKM